MIGTSNLVGSTDSFGILHYTSIEIFLLNI